MQNMELNLLDLTIFLNFFDDEQRKLLISLLTSSVVIEK